MEDVNNGFDQVLDVAVARNFYMRANTWMAVRYVNRLQFVCRAHTDGAVDIQGVGRVKATAPDATC
jgi:hypothetical protein